MLHKLWGDTSFHRLLLKIDEDVAQGVRSKGCPHCAGVLHSARYERKPRGGPSELPAKYERRASFCCAAAGCRMWRDNQGEKRATIRMRIDVATRPRVT